MDRSSDDADFEPRIKQYGFNIASAAAKSIAKSSVPKTPDKTLHTLDDSGRTASLDAASSRPGWKWLKGRKSSKRLNPLHSLESQGSSNLSSNSVLKPRWSSSSDREGLKSPLRFGGKDPDVSLAERKSTGDSSKWALGADWQEDGTESPLSLMQNVSRFRGFKDDCEAGSFTLGTLSQAVQSNGRIEVVGTLHSSEAVRRLVKSVLGGLRAWQQPEASTEGLGGTYFFMNELGDKQAIVKPCDEEPLAPNNPKGFVGRDLGEPGLKPTVRVGEAAMREVAAFLLDHNHFAKVPATALVRVTHTCFHVASKTQAATPDSEGTDSSQTSESSKISSLLASTVKPKPLKGPAVKLASMQEFVIHQSDCSEMGPSRFSTGDVHKIGILDLRLFNTDRHSGNLLVNQIEDKDASHPWLARRVELIPIDHGFCLPEALESPYFEWLHWPQAKVPFDEVELDYIAGLDANADCLFLQQELPWLPEGSLRVLQIATMLLKQCAAAGMTLFEIASVASRNIVGMDEEPSELEKLCLLARQKAEFEMEIDTIPESDESSSDVDFLEVLEEDTPGGKKGLIMGREILIDTQLSGDEMMFSLDEEPDASTAKKRDQKLGLQCPILREASFTELEAPGATEEGDVAKSLFAGLFPKVHAGVRHRRIRAGLASHRQRNKSGSGMGKKFVPPIGLGNIEVMSSVLDGLDKSGWAGFLLAFDECIQDTIAEGCWRQDSDKSMKQNAGFGVSCPQF